MEISCIVLAGGKSSRLGHNKITENIGGKMLLERVLDTLSLFKGEIIVVTSAKSLIPDLSRYPQAKIINDIFPDKGSLGGIFTGLYYTKTFYNLLVACDMPFLNFNLLKYMLNIAQDYDLAAYREGERFEPLHAVYSKNCLLPLERLLKQENVRIIELLHYVNARYLTLKEIEEFDPDHLSFFNINTRVELQKALEIANLELTRTKT